MRELFANGAMTPDGQRVIDYIERLMTEANDEPARINALPRFYQQYYIGKKTGAHTPASWLRTYPNENTLILEQLEKDDAAVQEANAQAETTNALVEQLAALKAELDSMRGELAAIKEGSKPKTGKASKKAAPDPEPEADDEGSPAGGDADAD